MDRIEQRSSHLCEDCFVGVSNTVEQYHSFLRGVTVLIPYHLGLSSHASLPMWLLYPQSEEVSIRAPVAEVREGHSAQQRVSSAPCALFS